MKEMIQKDLAENCLTEGRKAFLNNEFSKAIQLLINAKTIAESENNMILCAETANTLGVVYGAIGSISSSIEYYLEALRFAELCEYRRIMKLARNNIGSKYMDLGQYLKAIEILVECEQILEKEDTDTEVPMAIIIYLNLMDSYSQLGNYEEALKYKEKVIPYLEKDQQHTYVFPFRIILCKLKWRMGEKDDVSQLIASFLEYTISHRDNTNYKQNMSNLCELLQWTNDYQSWEKLLVNMEQYVSEIESVYLEDFVINMWLLFYKKTNQSERYAEKCIEAVEMHQRIKEAETIEKTAIIDTKLEIYHIMNKNKETEKKIQRDSLTGVGNRLKLNKDFTQIIEKLKKDHENLGVAMIDIDYFKYINDTFGHLRGDECLVLVAEILSHVVADKGFVYRIGGDEFVLLIPSAKRQLLEEIAEAIKKDLEQAVISNMSDKGVCKITLSQGYICERVQKNTQRMTVLNKADHVLYEVKRAGRNQYLIK